jgi:hypothetical protein
MPIYGWDSSHFDAPSIGSAVAEGFTFFTHKAGGDKNDAEIATWWSGVKNVGDNVLLGAYWVLYPGSPTARADAFLARLDATCPGWRNRPFILQVDCEKSEIKTFCDRLDAKMPKLRPIVYAPEWVYHDTLTGLGYPLWASVYVSGSGSASKLYPGDSSSKWGAYSGQTPAILQFTASATIAGQTTSDANAYRGTLDQLKALVAPGWTDDVSELDVTNALTKFFGATGVIAEGTYSTRVGKDALNQSVPNPFNPSGVKTEAWRLLQNSAMSMQRVEAVLSALLVFAQNEAAEIPASAQVIAEAVLGDLQGRTDEDTATALIAVLGAAKAAAIGQLMQGA